MNMTCRQRLPMTGHEACTTKPKPAHGRGQYSEYRRHVSWQVHRIKRRGSAGNTV